MNRIHVAVIGRKIVRYEESSATKEALFQTIHESIQKNGEEDTDTLVKRIAVALNMKEKE